MNVNTMRAIDRYVGIPLCWATGIWSNLFRHRKQLAPEQWRSVLVMKFFGMGSVLLSSSFVSALHERLPNVKIIYLTFGANLEMLEMLPQVSFRLAISTSSLHQFIYDSFRAWRLIQGESVDATFDLEFFSKFSTLVSFLSRAPVRVGYALPTYWRRMHLTVPVPFGHNKHVTQVFLSQLQAVGLPPQQAASVTSLQASLIINACMERALNLQSNGFEIIVVNINAGSTSLERRWPPGRFIEVCRALLAERPGVRFVFTGSIEERGYVEEALRHDVGVQHNSINAAGLLSLGELIALLERSSLLLTNDSGPMHIAAAMGRPVVALFGPESPAFYGPSAQSSLTIYKAISCSPCLNAYNAKLFVCPFDARCMKEISIAEVLAAVRSLRPALVT